MTMFRKCAFAIFVLSLTFASGRELLASPPCTPAGQGGWCEDGWTIWNGSTQCTDESGACWGLLQSWCAEMESMTNDFCQTTFSTNLDYQICSILWGEARIEVYCSY